MIFYNVDKKLSSDGKGAYSVWSTKSLIPIQKICQNGVGSASRMNSDGGSNSGEKCITPGNGDSAGRRETARRARLFVTKGAGGAMVVAAEGLGKSEEVGIGELVGNFLDQQIAMEKQIFGGVHSQGVAVLNG